MARRQVVEIQCDRCSKVEHQTDSEIKELDELELRIQYKGTTHQFSDLCRRCRGSVENLVNRLLKAYETDKDDVPTKNPVGVHKPNMN